MAKQQDEPDAKQRFSRARDLFDQAWSLPPDAREAFVRRKAGNDGELVAEVMRLLARADTAKGDDTDVPADADADAHPDSERESDHPKRIGRYRILSTLGEGGMGTVYLAEQREPMRRRVALKVLKKGMDSKAFLARFEAERQALAMMEHSCIARVYDAGMSDTGQSFIAMEYVKGVPITNYCDDNNLSIADRIELFVAVCSALQHAHTKGVMHRDLKPSNILVTVQDGRPEPKVIDFGLAKAVDHRLVEATVFTEAGQIIGTPEYMSPEQAGVGGLDIDTRTDVYSLGVLLYQLLTGALPVTRDELMRHGYFEMQRVIREDEMPKPSTKITTLGEGAQAFARARRLPLGELQRQLRGELDWIVMKAIEKDRGRRYTTVHELAADLVRHQNDEPVSAGPPSPMYVLRKLARRHRGAVFAGAGIVAALAVGLLVALWQWRETQAQSAIAQENAAAAEAARVTADAERDRANRNLANYEKLAGKVKLRQFEQRAVGLWPEGPDAVDRMTAWVGEVESWLAALHDPREALAELRQNGTKRGDDWEFATGGEEFLHDALEEFARDLAAFRAEDGTFGQVAEALDWSRRVLRETVDEHAAAWREVARRLRRHPEFLGTMLAAQPGLVPLGADPDSTFEEFWFARSGSAPERGPDGRIVMRPDTGIVLVLVPGGTLQMGSDDAAFGSDSERPVHAVELAPFFIAKYEMTQTQWTRWAGHNPSRWQRKDDPERTGPHPVESVSFSEVEEVLHRRGLSLPTEAQWEFACRAGTGTEWWLADDKQGLVQGGRGAMNIADGFLARAANKNYVPEAEFWPEFTDGFPVSARVGSFAANAFGLHDVHGNIAEFTRGPATPTYAGVEHAPGDGLILGSESERVVHRGGSFWKRAEDARSASRTFVPKDARHDSVGFRAARALDR